MSVKIDYREVMSRIKGDVDYVAEEAYNKGYEQAKLIWSSKTDEESYQRGLSEGNDIGYKDGVKDGQNEAWECAKKLFSTMSETEIEKVFPTEWNNGGFQALINLQPQEAIAKLKAYEDKRKAEGDINVGDEVISILTQTKGILIEPETKHLLATVIIPSQRWRTFNIRHASLKKTGKHYDIEKLLEDMSHDS